MRDIEAGEEICLDYAMCDGSNYDEFDCQCGSPNCHGRVTGEDRKRPELWERYGGYFSPYLQRRIAALKKEVHQKKKSPPNSFSARILLIALELRLISVLLTRLSDIRFGDVLR